MSKQKDKQLPAEWAGIVWLERQRNGLGQEGWAVYKNIGAPTPYLCGRFRTNRKAVRVAWKVAEAKAKRDWRALS